MKLKRKLLAAGLALGATALTLTTSTFAWYTANTEVSMSGVQGASAANGDSLLLISKTGANGTYSNSVTLTVNPQTLQPVQYTAGSAGSEAPVFNSFANGAVVTSAAAAVTNYVSFDLYFRSSAASHVYLKNMSIVNNTAASANGLPSKDILTTSGTTLENLSTKNTYKMDVLRTLKLAYYTEKHETPAATGSETPTTTTTAAVGSAFDFDGGTFCTYSATDDVATMTNAHTYYKAVTGKAIAETGDLAVTTHLAKNHDFGVTPASLSSNNDLCVHFYLFIDGWDLQCFDAVQGQAFTVTMDFSSELTA